MYIGPWQEYSLAKTLMSHHTGRIQASEEEKRRLEESEAETSDSRPVSRSRPVFKVCNVERVPVISRVLKVDNVS